MDIITLDFETYWANDYSLSNKDMTTEKYVRDPRFHAHSVAIKVNGAPGYYVRDVDDIAAHLNSLQLQTKILLCHHAHFDGLILSHHYNIRPAFWLDTLSMARNTYPADSVALANLCKLLGLPEKKTWLLESTKNKLRLNEAEHAALAPYAIGDVDNAWEVFQRIKPRFPLSELQLIDMTVRLFTEPTLILNPDVLADEITAEQTRKAELLARIGADKETLQSSAKFAGLLYNLGVDPPVKPSPTALKKGHYDDDLLHMFVDSPLEAVAECEERGLPWAYAFSKSDEAFKLLVESEDELVSAVCEARLGVKSTINETRATRMHNISQRGAWPVYLLYSGAHTNRWSGGDKLNPQNFTRGGALRKSVYAPPGCILVVADLAQIEARVLALLAGQLDLLNCFANKEDPYCMMATTIYNRVITKMEKIERHLGKAVVLGCGYGLGHWKFQQMVRVGILGGPPVIFTQEDADKLGVETVVAWGGTLNYSQWILKNEKKIRATLPPGLDLHSHAVHCATAHHILQTYRNNNPGIVKLWSTAKQALQCMEAGVEMEFCYQPILKTGKNCIWLPNGLPLQYTDLQSHDGNFSILKRKNQRSKVYGGLVVENLTQAIARIIIAEQMLQMTPERFGCYCKIAMTTHDEVVLVVPEAQGAYVKGQVELIMRTPPSWAPNLPLDVDCDIAYCYGDAK